jgi:ribonuclease BN (tRNA processing enzyme)
MEIRVLGAHNCESKNTRLTSLLVDNKLALDASSLTSSLSFKAQSKLKAICITHGHYDHIRDIPALAMNLFLQNKSIDIYAHYSVFNILKNYLLNNEIYPDFFERPDTSPVLRFVEMKPYQIEKIDKYQILAIPVNHSIPAIGYQVSSDEGKIIFYTGDTGIGLSEAWEHVSPQLLFIELTAPDGYEESVGRTKHLTPHLLMQELISFKKLKGYLPQVITVHMSPLLEKEIYDEASKIALELGITIKFAGEGMKIIL